MNEVTDRINDLETLCQSLKTQSDERLLMFKTAVELGLRYKRSMEALRERLSKFRLDLKPDPKFGREN
jgi:hypothetical protein